MSQRPDLPLGPTSPPRLEVSRRHCGDPACDHRRWRVCGRPGCLTATSYGHQDDLKRRSESA